MALHRAHPWLTRCLLAALPPAALVAALEGVARLGWEHPPGAPLMVPAHCDQEGNLVEYEPSPIHQRDPDLVWRNLPDLDLEYLGAHVRTNRFGLRGRETTRPKPPGVLRILSLGESSSFGIKVEEDETYAAVLERLLNVPGRPRRVEVLNAGVIGWSMAQSVIWLEREGIGFEPDVVLLYHGYNDFLASSYLSRRAGLSPADEPPEGCGDLALLERPVPWWRRAILTLRRQSVLVDCLALAGSDGTIRVSAHPDPEAEDKPAGSAVRVPDADRRRLLDRFLALADERHFVPVLINPAYRVFDRHRELLATYAAEHPLRYVDLEQVVHDCGLRRQELFVDPVHPGARLHRAIALRLARELRPLLPQGS